MTRQALKQLSRSILTVFVQIIQTSRKKFLFNLFRENNKVLSRDLINQLREKWTKYFQDTLLPITEKQDASLIQSTAEQTWIALVNRIESDQIFKDACIRQSEKFGMQFQQLVRVHQEITPSLLTSLFRTSLTWPSNLLRPRSWRMIKHLLQSLPQT